MELPWLVSSVPNLGDEYLAAKGIAYLYAMLLGLTFEDEHVDAKRRNVVARRTAG